MANFFYIDENGQKQGPFNEQQLQALMTSGIITANTQLETDAVYEELAEHTGQMSNPDAKVSKPSGSTIVEPPVSPPPIIETESKGQRNSNKVLISIIIVIGIVIAILTVDYFMGKSNNPSSTKPEEEFVQNIETDITDIAKQNTKNMSADTVQQITEQTTASISPDSSTLSKADEKENALEVSEKNKPEIINKVSSTVQPVLSNAKSKIPSKKQLNDLLDRITSSDDYATDEIRKVLGNTLRVEGANNISNVQELITDVSKGSRYIVTKVNTNADGKVISISVSK